MKTLSALSALPLALFGFTTLAGCSAPPGDGASSSSEAYSVSKPGIIAGTLFTTMQSLMKVNDAKLAVDSGSVVFTPSAPIAAYMGGPVSFVLPVVSESAKDGLDAPSLAAGTLQMVGPPTFKLGTGADTTIALDVRLDGTIVAKHATCSLDGCTNESIASAVSMHVLVHFAIASGGALSVNTVNVRLPSTGGDECTANPWCASLWSAGRLDAEVAWAQATSSALASQLAVHQPAWLGALDATINSAPVRVSDSSITAPPWHVVAPSLAIASGAIHYIAKRDYATSVPSSCKTYSACEGFIGVYCASSTDDLRLQTLKGGQWTGWSEPSSVGPSTTAWSWNAKGLLQQNVRVCATNSTGSSCTPLMSITPHSDHCPPVNVPPPPAGTL